MKKLNIHLIPKKLFLLLITFIIVGCEKSNTEKEQDLDRISKEVRASLDGEIVYYRGNDIYKSNAKYGGLGSLIGTNAIRYFGVKWSPDGSKIAYIKFNININGLVDKYYLVICSKDGVEQHEWLLKEPFNSLIGITWSPDGIIIAVLTPTKIIYIEVATGKLTTSELVSSGGYFSSIAWCPKGNKIAIAEVSNIDYGSSIVKKIWMLEAFENNPQSNPSNLLITNSDVFGAIECMDWSMDGSMLVYSGGLGIYTVNSDGSENQKIILKYPFEDRTVDGYAPCWMSNNNQIIFVSLAGINNDFTLIYGLFVTDINGSYKVDLKIPGEYPDCY